MFMISGIVYLQLPIVQLMDYGRCELSMFLLVFIDYESDVDLNAFYMCDLTFTLI